MARPSKVAEAKIADHSPARPDIDIRRLSAGRSDGWIPRANNPRTHSEEQVDQIAASIVAFGWTNPVLVDENDTILAGHARVLAAKKLRMEAVPVIILRHLTDAAEARPRDRGQSARDRRALLRTDEETLRIELAILHEEEYNLDLLGFADVELARLLEAQDASPGLTDEDAAPELPVVPVSRSGDLWTLGGHVKCPHCGTVNDV